MKKNAILFLACILAAVLMTGQVCQAFAEEILAIKSVVDTVGDEDVLITYEAYGTTYYGVYHPDGSISTLFLDEGYAKDVLAPGVSNLSHEFGVLPNGDYYEQVYTKDLSDGGVIIYAHETIVYMSTPENGAEIIMGAYGDKVIMLRRKAGFTENTWTLFMMGHDGTPLGTGHDVAGYAKELMYSRFEELGCGVLVDRKGVFDTNTDTFIITGVWYRFYPFAEETRSALWDADCFFEISVDDFAAPDRILTVPDKKESIDYAIAMSENVEFYMNLNPDRDTIGEGLVYSYTGHKYVDYAGNTVFPVPDYGGATRLFTQGRFHKGYAPVIYTGADEYYYITMIDRQGNPQYNPILLQNCKPGQIAEPALKQQEMMDVVMWKPSVFVDAGYVFFRGDDSGPILITPQGETISLPDFSLSDIYGMKNGYILGKNFLIRLTDPYTVIREGYRDPDDFAEDI